jgi:hypothetical protein
VSTDLKVFNYLLLWGHLLVSDWWIS